MPRGSSSGGGRRGGGGGGGGDRGARSRHPVGRQRGRGRRTGAAPPSRERNGFRTSRLQEVGSDDESESQDESDPGSGFRADQDEVQTDSEDEATVAQPSYASLLQALNAGKTSDEPARKKRRLGDQNGNGTLQAEVEQVQEPGEEQGDLETADAGLTEAIEDDDAEERDDGHLDSDDESVVLHDPFEQHYARREEEELNRAISRTKEKQQTRQETKVSPNLRKLAISFDTSEHKPKLLRKSQDLHLKKRLLGMGTNVFNQLSLEEKDFALEVFAYRDVQCGRRTVENASNLRNITCLHALNHVFKTRDRVLKNNAKASQHSGEDELELRDQGFTRPKVLFILPTKQSCARHIDSIARLSEAEQQENRSRFFDTFSSQDDSTWDNKPEDFRELFGGNHEEDFRVGLKFTRKTIKYFSGFYNSDIIFGSALGLMRTIMTGGGTSRNEKKKAHDADFLSSIEVVIIDNAAAIQMQNWQHLEYIFTQLNLIPKETHGCEFSRVRNWYLDGNAKYLRQTVLFTAYQTPEINSLYSTHTFNISGLVKYTPTYHGAMLTLPPTFSFVPSQTFLRFESARPDSDSDARFTYFNTTILPPLLRHNIKGVLIFVPTYADFTRLRNYFTTSASTTNLSFGCISEYTPVKEVNRARSHFSNARHTALIYTERAHHHFRYKLKGVRKLIFYGVPENPIFWAELLNMLVINNAAAAAAATTTKSDGSSKKDLTSASSSSTPSGSRQKGQVRALFSRWDALKLERIVGTERIPRLITDKAGDVFEFV